MDPNAYFWQVQSGALPVPPAGATLGIAIRHVDADAGTIDVEFQARPEFANPIGHVQGGFLAAMLDDTMGPALSRRPSRRASSRPRSTSTSRSRGRRGAGASRGRGAWCGAGARCACSPANSTRRAS